MGSSDDDMPPPPPANLPKLQIPSTFDIEAPHTWELHEIELENYFLTTKTTDDTMKRGVLLASCGKPTLALLRGLIEVRDFSTVSYDTLVTALREYFNPGRSPIVKCHEFFQRVQKPGEKIADYVADLRLIARECDFGATLNRSLRDRFVTGLYDQNMRARIFAIKYEQLTFSRALNEALAIETAAGDARQVHEHKTDGSVNFMSGKRSKFKNSRQKFGFTSRKTEFESAAKGPVGPEKDLYSRVSACHGCGSSHVRARCPFRDAECHHCHRKGHIARVCRTKSGNSSRRTSSSDRQINTLAAGVYSVAVISTTGCTTSEESKYILPLFLDGVPHSMLVDSGSPVSIISEIQFDTLFRGRHISIDRNFRGITNYCGDAVGIKGACNLTVQFGQKTALLTLLIARGNRRSIIGREWFSHLGIYLAGVNAIESSPSTPFDKFSHLFEQSNVPCKVDPVVFPLPENTIPIRLPARRVPLALRPLIEAELDRLKEQGVIEQTDQPRWATPIVTPIKPDGTVRICGDYKCTLNKVLPQHAYPIPVITHLLTVLAGSKVYAKLDLAKAYLQLPVNRESADAQTIITHKGAFRVNRLQYGVNIAPGLFQQFMETVLIGLDGVVPYFDDVIVHAKDELQLSQRVSACLERFKKYELRLRRDKCSYNEKSVHFLGFIVSEKGISPDPEKIKAIRNAPTPVNKQELQAFLGLLNFYSQFSANKATIAEPLHELLREKKIWEWNESAAKAFMALKRTVSSDSILAHFDNTRPIVLTTDASPVGVGGVLGNVKSDGTVAPVAFYSRALSPAERNYSQTDREALAIIASVKKFHAFLYGHSFTVITDHKPLLGIFTADKPTPDILSPRMIRWCITLNAYNYKLQYKKGKEIVDADSLSRMPQSKEDSELTEPLDILYLSKTTSLPITFSDLSELSARDPSIRKLVGYAREGWPPSAKKEFPVFFKVREHLSIKENCLMYGQRVVVPEVSRPAVLKMLHEGHPGTKKMKTLARAYVWWPAIDVELERYVKDCRTCLVTRPDPPSQESSWRPATAAWARVHLDFFGPFQGHQFLIAVDAYSRWVDVIRMPTTTASALITAVSQLFCQHGIPFCFVSDNGAQFTSEQFQSFLRRYGILQVLTPPYHPNSNGLAEGMVRVIKDAMRKDNSDDNVDVKVARILLHQHVTPSTVTGKSPAELMCNRRFRTPLDGLLPNDDVKPSESTHLRRAFDRGQAVLLRFYSQNKKTWRPGCVVKRQGACLYYVKTPDGATHRRHVDQLRADATPSVATGTSSPAPTTPQKEVSPRRIVEPGAPSALSAEASSSSTSDVATPPLSAGNEIATPRRLQPYRIRRPPQRYAN